MAQAACCSASAPLIALLGVTLASAAASAIRSRSKLLLSLSRKPEWHQLSSENTADRLVGCCVGYTLSIKAAALALLEARVAQASRVVQAARCSARGPLIALLGVTLAAAAASAIRSRSKMLLSLSRKLEWHRPLAARRGQR